MNDTNRQLKWKRISYYSNERHHVNEVNNAILYIYYYFPFFSIRYLNAVKYTRRLSTEYPPELGRVPGLIESTAVVHGPRRQPAALLPKIIAKLKEMEKEGHLAKVSQLTDWVNSMVVSSRGEKIRICLDPGDLNKAVKREHYPIPTVEEIVAKIPEAKVFTVLDAKSGYLQMKLDYESSLLTTMNTPIGRYRWLKLPFGIKSAPELYQRAMDEMLEDIDHAYAIMDDILIAGRDIAHHDSVDPRGSS